MARFSHIDTEKAYRSYKGIEGHRSATALWLLQVEILEAANRVLVSRSFIRKYPDDKSGPIILNRALSALYALTTAKRTIRAHG